MKKIKLLLAVAFFVWIIPILSNTEDLLNKDLAGQVKQKFNDYIDARKNLLLFTCTQKLANTQDIELTPDFYKQENHYSTIFTIAKQTLQQILNQAKEQTGKEANHAIDDFLKFDTTTPPIAPNTMTRGYCQNYERGFSERIADNLAKYQLAKSDSHNKIFQQKDAVYLNPRFQIIQMTNDLEKQGLPSTLSVDTKIYPLHCRYQNVQYYEQAIATNTPINDMAYKISQHFYQQYSPQINYILTCQTNVVLSNKEITRFNDTHPWYRPIVIGSNGEPAAGDALIYLDKNQLAIILGHEPCICNNNTETTL